MVSKLLININKKTDLLVGFLFSIISYANFAV